MEANKTGSNYLAMKKEAYFHKGLIGDWSNHLTPGIKFRISFMADVKNLY